MIDVRFREVVIDCADPPTLAKWWSAFTGYAPRTTRDDWATIESVDKELEAMGAARRWVSDDPEDPFVVLADPEEFCLIRDV